MSSSCPSTTSSSASRRSATRAAPALLLIGGAEASMDWWEDEFCERLAAGGRYVVRYDTRDTGRSTTYPVGGPPYGGDELIADAVGVLDALGIAAAHVVGISAGGGVAQHLAVEHPERVASLTLISTTPDGPGGADHADLPPMSAALAASFSNGGETPDWSDLEAVIDYYTAGERMMAGTIPVDDRGAASRLSPGPGGAAPTWPRARTTGSSTAARRSATASERSRCRRSCCTARQTRCFRIRTARPWRGRSRERGSCRSRAWDTRCRRARCGTR